MALTAIHHVQPEFLQRLVKEKLPDAQATVEQWVERLRKPTGMAPTDAQQQADREQQVRCLHAHVARFGFADVQDLLRFQELLERVSVR